MLMMGLLAAAVIGGIAFFMRKRAAAQAQSAGTGMGGMQYAHITPASARDGRAHGDAMDAPAYKIYMPAGGRSLIGSSIGSGIGAGVAAASSIPEDFDTAGFERNARVNFIRLQVANDAGNLDDIRQFTTPEMYAEIKMDLTERGATMQKSDVVHITAQVLEVAEDADCYVVSVRFTGLIRDEIEKQDESFDEVWHMTKSRQ
jgi:predicted lipid-binding transport protein (Tim44 family)